MSLKEYLKAVTDLNELRVHMQEHPLGDLEYRGAEYAVARAAVEYLKSQQNKEEIDAVHQAGEPND